MTKSLGESVKNFQIVMIMLVFCKRRYGLQTNKVTVFNWEEAESEIYFNG